MTATAGHKSLRKLCAPRDSVFGSGRKDTVLDLTDLIEGRIDAQEFLETNYVTDGMRTLLREAFLRFARRSQQGTFLLTQAMGGGKTHNMIALGLLAKHPELREQVMEEGYDESLGEVRVAAFTGRESDEPFGIWGAIAEQLGKKEAFSDYYSPLAAPGQTAWVNLLKGEPLLIMLDELPPYFVNAKARTVGNSDLATVTTTALSNLLVAVGRPELENVCVVISDLTAAYGEGSKQIGQALDNFDSEVGRSAMELEPVQQNTTEVYDILRQKLFKELPGEEDRQEVARGYAHAVKDAKQMDVTDASPQEYARRIKEAFPFHFSVRDLYARFRENPGFQQTRDLIRLMRTVVAHLYEAGRADDISLIHPYDLDLNHKETFNQVVRIKPSLKNAISSDIASDGSAVAETIDDNRGGRDARDLATLLLMASLADVPRAVRGLTKTDLISHLCRPGRDVGRIEKEALKPFFTKAIYLHTDTDGRLHFKNVKNINAQLRDTAKSYNRQSRLVELRDFLKKQFEPSVGDVYQQVQVLPPVDEISVTAGMVTLILDEPTPGGGLSEDLQAFYEDTEYKNRVLFLTGQRGTLSSLLENAARLKGIRYILDEMKAERTSERDPQFTAAQEIEDDARLQLLSAARETFTTIIFPHTQGLRRADFHMNFEGNSYNGEEQVRQTLKQKEKFTSEIEDDTFRRKCEQRLFTQNPMLWREIENRAAVKPAWPWHKPGALERLKDRLIHQDQWRDDGSGYVRKPPFPKAKTDVRIHRKHRDPDTGEVTLNLTPVHGDTIYYEMGAGATTASARVENPQGFKTRELEVSFLCVDESGEHERGDSVTWHNEITVKSRVFQGEDGNKKVELKAVPEAPIRYTTDGSNPSVTGGHYEGPFAVEKDTPVILAEAEKNGVTSDRRRVTIDWEDEEELSVDPECPALWDRPQQRGTTQETYQFVKRLREHDAKAQGPRIFVQAEGWVDLSFDQSMEVDADTLEASIEHLRTLIDGAEVTVEADALRFASGRNLLGWAEQERVTLNPQEVEQS